MRQQLITWLIDDLAPEIRKNRDAEGTILKFAKEQNLASSLVQALGQLYNTAKTIAFLEKSGSKGRGESFPILDVDGMVAKYMDMPVKEAGIPEGTIDNWELINDDGVLNDLPSCFEGILTPAFKSEEVVNPVPDRSMQKAAAEADLVQMNREFAEQFVFETREDMIKTAGTIVRHLRMHPEHTFEELEADALGLYGERIRPVMDKLAAFCQGEGWKVARAKTASTEKLLSDYSTSLLKMVDQIDDGLFKVAEAQSYLEKEAVSGTATGSAKYPRATRVDRGRPGAPGWGPAPPPARLPPLPETGDVSFQDFGSATKPLPEARDSEEVDFFGQLNKLMDRALGTREPVQKALGTAFKGPNKAQEKVDAGMMDARHMAVLSNLMTNDEILAEADPERVAQMYNTIRENAPELSTDINVMRVLLRSAVQHDGIAPFDLKSILETELAKQKTKFNRNLQEGIDYQGKEPLKKPNKPM